jgi:hypothetical protein
LSRKKIGIRFVDFRFFDSSVRRRKKVGHRNQLLPVDERVVVVVVDGAGVDSMNQFRPEFADKNCQSLFSDGIRSHYP